MLTNRKKLKNKINIKVKSLDKKNYSEILIDKNNDKYQEKMVDISNYGIKGFNYYYSDRNPPYYQSIPGSINKLLVRSTVAQMLQEVNKILYDFGLELFVFDAYRPIEVQNYFYSNWVPNYLKKKYPNKSITWINNELSKYWVKGPKDINDLKKHVAPHLTGGALDLTLIDKKTGLLLEMGTIFDDTTDKSFLSHFEDKHEQLLNFTEEEALKNRRILFNAMISVGFAYHPHEWWHYSFGDQIWAYIYNKKAAFYGYTGFLKN